jgi:hypothetical protein
MDFLARQGAFCRRNGTNYGEKKERSMDEKDLHISEKYNFRHALKKAKIRILEKFRVFAASKTGLNSQASKGL